MDTAALKKQRAENKHAVLNNVIPSRVPIEISLSNAIAAEYGSIDKKEALWNPLLMEDAMVDLSKKVFSDVALFGPGVLYPSYYQALGARNCVMSSEGYMQHPNTVGMAFEDYPAFIENAYDCVIERVLPRNYSELDFVKDPGNAMLALLRSMNAQNKYMSTFAPMGKRIAEMVGLAPAKPFGGGGYTPFDFMTDQLRSFSEICKDVRRHRDLVIEAAKSSLILCYKAGFGQDPDSVDRDRVCFFALHMAPYLRTKDFEEIWWANWFKQVSSYASYGMRTQAFCEQDFTRYFDFLDDLPTGTVLQFEKGDPKAIKERFGDKFVLTGLYPISSVLTDTREQAVDRVKEFLDIMAPGGNFFFAFDKKPLGYSDIKLENLIAICDTVREYGKYDNAGAPTGKIFHKEDYTRYDIPEFKSKYFRTWEQYKAANPNTPDSARKTFEKSEFDILKYIYRLCQ